MIDKFYTAMAAGDAERMINLYHPDIVFQDPAFGELHGSRAMNMWRMLVNGSKGELIVKHGRIRHAGDEVHADWQAEYPFGRRKKMVINEVNARFRFRDGLISEHVDRFDLWKWSRQALGISGVLLGWTGFMRNRIQATSNRMLDKFEAQLTR